MYPVDTAFRSMCVCVCMYMYIYRMYAADMALRSSAPNFRAYVSRVLNFKLLGPDAAVAGSPSGRSNTESFECLEMLCGKTWREQADLYAVAATVHCLLHQVITLLSLLAY
jgi:hypothetical protein